MSDKKNDGREFFIHRHKKNEMINCKTKKALHPYPNTAYDMHLYTYTHILILKTHLQPT